MAISLLLWNVPVTHAYLKTVDVEFAKLLNLTLDNKIAARIVAFLNMKFESYANAAALLSITVFYILSSKEKVKSLSNVVLLWVYLNICFGLKKYIIIDLLDISRDSPSMSIDGFTRVSEMFPQDKIKDSSNRSFLGDHAFAMFFWIFFSIRFMPKKYFMIITPVAVFFSLPRMFSGAHWLSDTLFAIFLADFLTHLVTSTFLFELLRDKIKKLLLASLSFCNLAKK